MISTIYDAQYVIPLNPEISASILAIIPMTLNFQNHQSLHLQIKNKTEPQRKQKICNLMSSKSSSISSQQLPLFHINLTHNCDDGDDDVFEQRLQSFHELKKY